MGGAVQPLPKATPLISADKWFAPTMPDSDAMTQLCDAVREPLRPGGASLHVPKPERCALRTA